MRYILEVYIYILVYDVRVVGKVSRAETSECEEYLGPMVAVESLQWGAHAVFVVWCDANTFY